VNPITHLLATWSLAEASRLEARDRAIVTWVGLSPDLDGLGAIPDVVARVLGHGDPAFYGRYHHLLLHGLFGAVLLPAIAMAFARRRLAVFLWGVAAVHLHLACDLVGSRGPAPEDVWPIHYLAPFTETLTLSWSGQWPLNAWQNVLFTLVLLAFAFVRAATVAHSPVSLFSSRAHKAFVTAVQRRWRQSP
jgi:inner membrane protein